ncbi:MAG: endonuclease NucS, partial [Candidatus Bathyarchaeia archaeon]
LRKYLVNNLTLLEHGLKLYQDQERTGEEYPVEGGRMRIDILAMDSKDNFVVVELKAGVADVSTFGQISAYIGWVKENLAKNSYVRGIIVANDFDDKIKYAVKLTPHIKLKRYKLMFEFEDEKS